MNDPHPPDADARCTASSGGRRAWAVIAAMTAVTLLAALGIQHLSHAYKDASSPAEAASPLLRLALVVVPEYNPAMIDPDAWGQLGMQVASGKGLLEHGAPSAFRGPTAPLIFAAVAKVFGPSYQSLLYAQCVWFALAGGAVGILCQRLLGDWRITLVAMLLYLGFIPAYPWFCHIFTEPLFTLLLALLMIGWTCTLERPAAWSLGTGAMLGAVALCRPVMYFFLPVMVLVEFHRKGRSRWAAASIGALLIGFLLLEVPWVVRNQLSVGRPVVTTSGGAQALYLATWYQQANWMGNVFHDPQRFPPAGEGFWELPAGEQEERFRAMARENLREAPLQVLLLIPKRTLMFLFQMRETGWMPTSKSLVLCGAVYPAAVLGFLLLAPPLRKRYLPVLWLIAFHVAFHSLLQAEYRYSHPVQPYIFMLAAAGVVLLASRTAGRSVRTT